MASAWNTCAGFIIRLFLFNVHTWKRCERVVSARSPAPIYTFESSHSSFSSLSFALIAKYSGVSHVIKTARCEHILICQKMWVYAQWFREKSKYSEAFDMCEIAHWPRALCVFTRRRVGALYKRMKEYHRTSVWISNSSWVVCIFLNTEKLDTKNVFGTCCSR